jgi:hypothetical protein
MREHKASNSGFLSRIAREPDELKAIAREPDELKAFRII